MSVCVGSGNGLAVRLGPLASFLSGEAPALPRVEETFSACLVSRSMVSEDCH